MNGFAFGFGMFNFGAVVPFFAVIKIGIFGAIRFDLAVVVVFISIRIA